MVRSSHNLAKIERIRIIIWFSSNEPTSISNDKRIQHINRQPRNSLMESYSKFSVKVTILYHMIAHNSVDLVI